MKTIDEVLEAMTYEVNLNSKADCWEVPVDLYGVIIHYLHEYRDAKNTLDIERKNSIEAYRQWQDAKEKLEAQTSHTMWVDNHFQFEISDNPPLTWQELQAMEDKPVWVEVDGKWWGKFWAFVEAGSDSYINFYQKGQEYPEDLWKSNMGKTWNAFRKERE